eukprot:RCo051956
MGLRKFALGIVALAVALLLVCSAVNFATTEVQHEALVEACCCTREFVDSAFEEVLTTLNSVTRRPYFRYFKANLDAPCPFWAVELICSPGMDPKKPPPCHVCTCDENEVPVALRDEGSSAARSPARGEGFAALEMERARMGSRDEEEADDDEETPEKDGGGLKGSPDDHGEPSSEVDPTLSEALLSKWRDSTSMWFQPDRGRPMEYYDLVRNPEANTGYTGDSASRIWRAIYTENCFRGARVLPPHQWPARLRVHPCLGVLHGAACG